MTPRYDSLQHPERDKAIQEYANQHPDFSHDEIAKYFGLSRSRITQILGGKKKEQNVSQLHYREGILGKNKEVRK